MNIRKILAFTVLGVMLCSGIAGAVQTEDALSTRTDDSVYLVLNLEDTSAFLQWLFSQENIKLFMPLIASSDAGAGGVMAAEMVSTLVSQTPLRSAAVVTGITKEGVKSNKPFMQGAFTFSPEVSETVKKLADGQAEALDVAKLILGDQLAASFAETMIKLQPEKNGIYRLNNELFIKASGDVVVLGTSMNEVRLALKAMGNEESRLFTRTPRRFTERDFALIHMDFDTMAEIKSNEQLEDVNIHEIFAKPLEAEFAFKTLEDRFIISTSLNLIDALTPKYFDMYMKQSADILLTQGGNIDITNAGGHTQPILAVGTTLDFSTFKDDKTWKPIINGMVRRLKRHFGITEDEITALVSGPLSVIVNDSVTYESLKVPAVYISQTGQAGASAKIFERLGNSKHFTRVSGEQHEGLLQMDTSLSPISCLVSDRNGTLLVDFAELSSLAGSPDIRPMFAELLGRESIASIWLDFASLQAWINDENNGLMAFAGPMAVFAGFGKQFQAFREVLKAELSVPSLSIWTEKPAIFHMSFENRKIDPENGLIAKIIKAYLTFKK